MFQDHASQQTQRIHPTAVVSPNAILESHVAIGPYAVIGDHVTLGQGTTVGAHAVIDGWTTIGKNCVICSGAAIGGQPQDKKFAGEKSYVSIGNHTQIHEFATVNRATGEEQETRVGSHCLLLAYSHVAHNCSLGNHVILSNAVHLAGHVELADRVTIGGLSGVHQFVKIGRNAMIGGASKVVQDIPPFITVDGNPAQPAGLNTIGMIRSGISEEVRRTLKRAYKILYLSGLRLPQAIDTIENLLIPSPELTALIHFLRHTERGICRGSAQQRQKRIASLPLG